jgi:hypothetical protein
LREFADTDDAIAFDGEIGDVAGASGAVDDASVFDQEIKLGCLRERHEKQ